MEESDFSVVIMQKNPVTNLIEREIGSFRLGPMSKYIESAFAFPAAEGGYALRLRLTTDFDVPDEVFSDYYDYYDEAVFDGLVRSLREVEDCFNPTWELVVDIGEEADRTEAVVTELLARHAEELRAVAEELK